MKPTTAPSRTSRTRLDFVSRVAACVGVGLFSAATFAGVPTSYQPGQNVGSLNTSSITEASGLVAGHTTPGVLWTHNDSNNPAQIFAIDTQSHLLAVYTLLNRINFDFEDIARGPGPIAGTMYLYVGDIGDNAAIRSSIVVYRIVEPAPMLSWAAAPHTSNTLTTSQTIALNLSYPDGPHNAETLFIDPISGDLFIATKQNGSSYIYTAAASLLTPGSIIQLTYVRTVTIPAGEKATGGDTAPDGSAIIIRGNNFGLMWQRGAGQTVAQALGGTPTTIPIIGQPTEEQGEAICFADDGQGYYTISEGSNVPLYFFAPAAVVPSCPPDFNLDTIVDVADLFGYINAWLAKDTAADFNHDSFVDVADLFGYINAWLAKC